jgi:hypothetical protein
VCVSWGVALVDGKAFEWDDEWASDDLWAVALAWEEEPF